jgi:inner membrane transporter RhtA
VHRRKSPGHLQELTSLPARLLILLVAMVSVQIGAAVAKTLLPLVGAPGATAQRLALGTLMLMIVWRPWRPWRVRPRPRPRAALAILVYGASMGCMNLLFYSALRRIPLGIAVALEFTGPLAVAMFASRRPVDFVWVALTAVGLFVLLPIGVSRHSLDPAGIGYALGAGVCWALYILFGKRAGMQHGGHTAALGMLVAAILIVPIGIADAGARLLNVSLLPAALAMALLSSAIPYSLEMFVLTRLPTRTFGVLMSLEPVLGAIAGLLFLGERLNAIQWAAVFSIVIASAGSAATSRAAGG